jgi:hypothetical protein
MHDFREGDSVCLVTNPDDVMTVCSVFGQRLVECSWIGKEGRLYKNSFRPESLQLIAVNDTKDLPQQEPFIRISTEDDDEFTL